VNPRVAVVGGSGFVGSAVVAALSGRADVVVVKAPRITSSAREVDAVLAAAEESSAREELLAMFEGTDVVINAAGDPDASSGEMDRLVGANGVLPAVILMAARSAGVRRLVHLSSAVVQNDRPVLDESEEMSPFSDYSLSKVLGEDAVRAADAGAMEVVRFRPPSVHAETRRVSRGVSRIARSRVASVAADGSQPSPQALLGNVADGVAHLATTSSTPPSIVMYPWEGLTSYDVMAIFGRGRKPIRIPATAAKLGVRTAKWLGRRSRPLAANTRRLELLWLGQGQAESWLTGDGWTPPLGRSGWTDLAITLATTQVAAVDATEETSA